MCDAYPNFTQSFLWWRYPKVEKRNKKFFKLIWGKVRFSIPDKSFNVSKANIPQNIENNPCLPFNVWWDKFCIVRTKVFDVKAKPWPPSSSSIRWLLRKGRRKRCHLEWDICDRERIEAKSFAQQNCLKVIWWFDDIYQLPDSCMTHIWMNSFSLKYSWQASSRSNVPLSIIKHQSKTSNVTE